MTDFDVECHPKTKVKLHFSFETSYMSYAFFCRISHTYSCVFLHAFFFKQNTNATLVRELRLCVTYAPSYKAELKKKKTLKILKNSNFEKCSSCDMQYHKSGPKWDKLVGFLWQKWLAEKTQKWMKTTTKLVALLEKQVTTFSTNLVSYDKSG